MLARLRKKDLFFERPSPLDLVDAVPFHGYSHKGEQPVNIHRYIKSKDFRKPEELTIITS